MSCSELFNILTTARDARLTEEERYRNRSGVLSTQFTYDDSIDEVLPSSQPGFFPDLSHNHAKAAPFHLPTLGGGIDLILGLLDGVHLGASALAGFPSMKTIPHQGTLGYHGVNVFQSDSRNQSMVLTITAKHDDITAAEVAKKTIGQRTFYSWPYLHEGLVVAVSDETHRHEKHQVGKGVKVVSQPHNPFQAIDWRKQADHVEGYYSKRFGVITGHVETILHVRPLKGE
jgi:5'-3' exoribonuclease 1